MAAQSAGLTDLVGRFELTESDAIVAADVEVSEPVVTPKRRVRRSTVAGV